MKKKENLWWNSYHSSPKTIAANQEFCKSRSVSELIDLRDAYYEIIKELESKEYFNMWNPNEPWEQAYYTFDYEDALVKIAFICSVIKQKRDSMFGYCHASPRREYFQEFAKQIIELVKKEPNIIYSDVINQLGEDSHYAMDYLIEEHKIERRGTIDRNYWKTM